MEIKNSITSKIAVRIIQNVIQAGNALRTGANLQLVLLNMAKQYIYMDMWNWSLRLGQRRSLALTPTPLPLLGWSLAGRGALLRENIFVLG